MANVGWISFQRFPFSAGSRFACISFKLDATSCRVLADGMWMEVIHFTHGPDPQKSPCVISCVLTLSAGGLQGIPQSPS